MVPWRTMYLVPMGVATVVGPAVAGLPSPHCKVPLPEGKPIVPGAATRMHIRPYRPDDLDALGRITVEAFDGVSLDQNLEARFGLVNGHDWRWRKARQIEADVATYAEGVFVAEDEGRVVGFVTTQADAEAGIGRVPNMAVAADYRNRGLGRRLLAHALESFRRLGLSHARIETLEQNAVACHLYPACGFREIGRQVYYAIDLREAPLAPPGRGVGGEG